MPFEINEYFKVEFIIINADTPVIDGAEQTYQDHVSNMKARLTHAQVLCCHMMSLSITRLRGRGFLTLFMFHYISELLD